MLVAKFECLERGSALPPGPARVTRRLSQSSRETALGPSRRAGAGGAIPRDMSARLNVLAAQVIAGLVLATALGCGAPAPEAEEQTDDASPFSPAAGDVGRSNEPESSTDSGATSDGGTSTDDVGADTKSPATDAGGPSTKTPLGKYVLTWYSFQDNTPVNSAISGSGRKLLPYLSVAIPFRLLKPFGGRLNYGDKLYVAFLQGRTMPNGTKHTGWVQVDDFCGDSGDDSYCYQSVGGSKYPNVDLYIGDFTKSGMSPSSCTGPAGSGQELTAVSTGTPGGEWSADYGGNALGPGKCGDLSTAKPAHGSCWDYTPPASSASECASCTSSSCTSW